MVAHNYLTGKAEDGLHVVVHLGAICLALRVCAALSGMEGGEGRLAQQSHWAGGGVSVALCRAVSGPLWLQGECL